MSKKKPVEKIPIHQWTNSDGEVLIVRCIGHDGKSYCGFQNPLEVGATLTAPDVWDPKWGDEPEGWISGWIPNQECGGGIHGWPWGIGIGDGKEPDWSALWQVYGVKPEDIVGDVGDGPKCKFREGVLRYSGDWHGAALFILSGQMAWAAHTADGAATNSGYSGAATNSGYSGAATNSGDSGAATNSGDSGAATNSGDRGAATNSGDRGAATNSGYSGAATNSGYRGAATNSGDSGAATNSGDRGAALSTGPYSRSETSAQGTAALVTGLSGRARAAAFGCIALAWWNEQEQRTEMRCALTGAGKGMLKPDVWYRLNGAGEFEEDQ
jgi:hypothetical protein